MVVEKIDRQTDRDNFSTISDTVQRCSADVVGSCFFIFGHCFGFHNTVIDTAKCKSLSATFRQLDFKVGNSSVYSWITFFVMKLVHKWNGTQWP